MVRRLPHSCLVFAMAWSLAGCGTLKVVRPPGPVSGGVISATQPVTPLSVKLLNLYKDGFHATLDGAPIGGFTPAPAKNTTVSTPGPSCFDGGRPLPGRGNIVMAEHEFVAYANPENTGGIEVGNDRILFIPPGLLITPRQNVDLDLRNNDTVSITVAIVPGPLAPVPLSIVPNGPNVSINGQAAGTAASITLPTNAAGSFRVRAVSPGSYVVRVEARGVQCSGLSGYIR